MRADATLGAVISYCEEYTLTEVSRRSFLKLTAAGGAAAGGLGIPSFDQWVSPAVEPKEVPVGRIAFYATVCRECPAGCGMYGTYRDGRVYKAEGNPHHPLNHGTLCARGQASLQGQYDPDRLKGVLQAVGSPGHFVPSTWPAAIEAIAGRLHKGGRAVLVSNLETGSLAEVMRTFAERFGGGAGRPLFYEPFNYEPLKTAHQVLFGRPVVPTYRLAECEFILSLAADFLEVWVSPVEFAQQFTAMHTYENGKIGRMAYVGPRLSMTAGNADEFIQVEPDQIRWVGLAMLREMIERGWAKQDVLALHPQLKKVLAGLPVIPTLRPKTIAWLAEQFARSSASVALAGPVGTTGPIAVETAVVAGLLNQAAGRLGQTMDLARPHALSQTASRQQMWRMLESLGPQDVLMIYGANPAYNWPETTPALRKAGTVVYLGTLPTETSLLADWVLPTSYALEAWGDYSPYPDVHGLIQPTMQQLYPNTWLPGDILLKIAEAAGAPLSRSGTAKPAASYREWLTAYWAQLGGTSGAATTSQPALASAVQRLGGIFEKAGTSATQPAPQPAKISFEPPVPAPTDPHTADLWSWGHILLFDGRLANRTWMQENPEPVSALTWGSWIDIHPARAKALGVSDTDILELATAVGKIRAPARVTLDVAPGTVAIAFGQGHTAMGQIAAGVGSNTWALLGARAPASMFGQVTVRKADDTGRLVSVTHEQRQHQREILQWIQLSTLQQMRWGEGNPLIMPLPEGYQPSKDVYPPHFYPEHRWAMVIDLQRCIGCQACAVACYAENNLSIVGADYVHQGREMAWMQVQPFRAQGLPLWIGWIPMLCQHCDAAPCEPVCPVFAAVHNNEGLNAQIYNRCVGTRYCSNNCPYKVRRFNWIDMNWREPLNWQLNPEVTVRRRGVMEKCTFCIQRIRKAEYEAKLAGRKLRDGEFQTACQQTCPTRAILFGDLMDSSSEVARLTRNHPRRYHVLERLNVKPAITYLQRIYNDQQRPKDDKVTG